MAEWGNGSSERLSHLLESTPKLSSTWTRFVWFWKSCTFLQTALTPALRETRKSAAACLRHFSFPQFWVLSLRCLGVPHVSQIRCYPVLACASLPMPSAHPLAFSLFSFPRCHWNAQSGDCELPRMNYTRLPGLSAANSLLIWLIYMLMGGG